MWATRAASDRHVSSTTGRRGHGGPERGRNDARADLAGLGLDHDRAGRIEASRARPQPGLEQLLRSAGPPGRPPNREPRCAGQRLQIQRLHAAPRQRASAAPSCPSRWGRRAAPARCAVARRRGGAHLPALGLVAAGQHGRRASRPEPGRWPWPRTAGRRASSRPAAGSPRPGRPAAPSRWRGDVAGHHGRAGAAGQEAASPAHNRCPTSARSSSSSTGRLTAPGTWSWANSAGLRTSMIASKASRGLGDSSTVRRIMRPTRTRAGPARTRPTTAACVEAVGADELQHGPRPVRRRRR